MTMKQMLARADHNASGYQSLDRLENLLARLNSNRTLDPNVRDDILSLIEDTLDLSHALLDVTYPVSLVLHKTTNILSIAQRILLHTESHAPAKTAFGAMLPNGTLLPVTADTEQEARSKLAALMQVGVATNAMVIPIKISSQYILQPQALPRPTPPQEWLQPPATNEFVEKGSEPFTFPATSPPLPPNSIGTGQTAGIAGGAGSQSGPAQAPPPVAPPAVPPVAPPVVSAPRPATPQEPKE